MKICELFDQPLNANFTCANCKGNLGTSSDLETVKYGFVYECSACKKFELYLNINSNRQISGIILSYENYEIVFIKDERFFKIYKIPLRVWINDPPQFEVHIAPLEFDFDYHEITEEIIKLLSAY